MGGNHSPIPALFSDMSRWLKKRCVTECASLTGANG